MRLILFSLFLISALALQAGVSDGYYNQPAFNLNALLNNNIDMHHSYTFASGFSSSGNGWYTNVYTNHLDFKLHKNLDFKLDLNFLNAGTMDFDHDYDLNWHDDNNSMLLPEFELEWRPSQNTSLKIKFEQRNQYYRGYNSIFDNFLGDNDD